MILVLKHSHSRAVIWKDRHDPFGNMAFACLCGAPSLIVISKCSKNEGRIGTPPTNKDQTQIQTKCMGEWLWAVGFHCPLGEIDVPWVIVGVLSCLARASL